MSPKWICVFWAINRWGLAFRTCKTSSSSDGWRAIQQKRALLALLWRLCDRYKIRPCKSQQKTTGVKEVLSAIESIRSVAKMTTNILWRRKDKEAVAHQKTVTSCFLDIPDNNIQDQFIEAAHTTKDSYQEQTWHILNPWARLEDYIARREEEGRRHASCRFEVSSIHSSQTLVDKSGIEMRKPNGDVLDKMKSDVELRLWTPLI